MKPCTCHKSGLICKIHGSGQVSRYTRPPATSAAPPPPHIAKSEPLETLEPLPPKSGTNQHDVTTVEYQNELS